MLAGAAACTLAGGSGVRVVLDVPGPGALVARADPDRLRQALDNLLGNAVRFTPPASTVTVRARVSGNGLVVDVDDEDPGFPAGFHAEAFERFRRADAARTRDGAPHSGLGLAIVRSIATAHGGTATAADRPGGGARVTLRLPARLRARWP